ncbi:MAG: glutathione S-transferase family protein, partial [Pseudomonadota bacterium]
MIEIILHNYPQSPVAEKVRVALGIKGAAWRSVEIPRIPPKPNLVKLTGGYRRTPVMQIGADIYCDSQRIMNELDARTAEAPLYPPAGTAMAALARSLGAWTDGALFSLAVKLVLGSAGDALPADFAEDRGRLYLGPDWAEGLKAANADLPHLAAQMRAALARIDAGLAGDEPFLNGATPGAVDAQVYHVVWFIRGRWDKGAALLAEFDALLAWEARIRALGHGDVADLSAEDAIGVAAEASPAHPQGVAPGDPQGLTVGVKAVVRPDVDGGEQPVEGTIWSADANAV